MGYVAAFFVYHIGTLLTAGSIGTGFIPGLIAVAIMIGYVVYLMKKGDEKAALKLAAHKA